MAKKCLIEKCRNQKKFKVRKYNRCMRCGRPRAFIRDFKLCRICFRDMASNGEIPGIRKASW